MTLALFLAYCAATLAFSLAPGPAVLLVSAQAMARGAMTGIATSAGAQIANAIFWLVFSVGMGAVIAASETFFLVAKYAGAAYLIFLGVMTIRNARKAAEGANHGVLALWRSAFLQGFANQIANPKAFLYMAIFVPQFVTPGRTTAADIVLLAVSGLIIDFVVLSGYGWVAARTGALFRDPAKLIWRERAAGVAQIAVGGMIAAMRRVA